MCLLIKIHSGFPAVFLLLVYFRVFTKKNWSWEKTWFYQSEREKPLKCTWWVSSAGTPNCMCIIMLNSSTSFVSWWNDSYSGREIMNFLFPLSLFFFWVLYDWTGGQFTFSHLFKRSKFSAGFNAFHSKEIVVLLWPKHVDLQLYRKTQNYSFITAKHCDFNPQVGSVCNTESINGRNKTTPCSF